MSDKLRFKDENGQDYPEWEERFLSECGKFKKGKGLNKDDISNTGNDCILYGDLYTKYNEIITSVENKTETKITNPTLSKKGDILFPSSTTASALSLIAPSSIKQNNVIIGGDIIVFTPNNDINSDFLSYQINHFRKTQFAKYAEGITIVHIYSNLLGENIISIPSIKEQQKIADFLSTVDDKIENQKEIVANWEEIKKGLIQKIFSQEIRFKDENGQDYPEWEENNLGTIGFFKTSSVDKKIYENETIVNLVNYMDVYNKKILTNQTINSLDKTSAKESQLTENSLKKGDILFTPSSETPEDIGHSVVIVEDLPSTVYSYHLVRFRPTTSRLDVEYSNYFCNNDLVRSQIVAKATGSTRFTVSIKDLNNILVKIPSINEQQKIANLLSTVDKKIECEKNILNELIELKKGLLQRIFA